MFKKKVKETLQKEIDTIVSSLVDIRGPINSTDLERLNRMDCSVLEILFTRGIISSELRSVKSQYGYYRSSKIHQSVRDDTLKSLSKSDLLNLVYATVYSQSMVDNVRVGRVNGYFKNKMFSLDVAAWLHLFENHMSDDVIDAFVSFRNDTLGSAKKEAKRHTVFLHMCPKFFEHASEEQLHACNFRLDWLCEAVAKICRKDKKGYVPPEELKQYLEVKSVYTKLSGESVNQSFKNDIRIIQKAMK